MGFNSAFKVLKHTFCVQYFFLILPFIR